MEDKLNAIIKNIRESEQARETLKNKAAKLGITIEDTLPPLERFANTGVKPHEMANRKQS